MMTGIVITLNLEDVFGKILIMPADYQPSAAVTFYLLP